jgi:hypothetical protein
VVSSAASKRPATRLGTARKNPDRKYRRKTSSTSNDGLADLPPSSGVEEEDDEEEEEDDQEEDEEEDDDEAEAEEETGEAGR